MQGKELRVDRLKHDKEKMGPVLIQADGDVCGESGLHQCIV